MSGIQNAFGFMRGAGVVKGSQSYTTTGTYTWVAPTGVTKVSVLVIGGGAPGGSAITFSCGCSGTTYYYNGRGGGAGGTGYINNFTVVPGNSYTVRVGIGGCSPTNSFFKGNCTIYATYGCGICGGNGFGPCVVGFVGGQGGCNSLRTTSANYTGAGGGGTSFGTLTSCRGRGGTNSLAPFTYGYAGTCGGASGGASGSLAAGAGSNGGGGGGIGLFGRGSSGASACCISQGGNAGSSGTNGSNGTSTSRSGSGGSYGGGGGGGANRSGGFLNSGGSGASGAVRIVWPGCSRTFPSTCVGNP